MIRLIKRIPELFRRQITARQKTGPYRFLIRRWRGITDIDLAINVLGTQFYDSELVPMPLPVAQMRSFLILAPHQDDETIGAGGTLLLAKQSGAEIHVIFVTDGGPIKPISYGGHNPDEIVEMRKREAEAVCSQLGAQVHHLNINNAMPMPSFDDLDRLHRIIEQAAPQVILVPWLLDTPKHRLVNHLLWLTDRRNSLSTCEVWGYQVHNVLLPNGYVDITAMAEEKRKLLERYQSQLTYYRPYDHMAMGMAAWNSRFVRDYKGDPTSRYVEIFCALPLHEHLKLIKKFYLPDLNATYRGNLRSAGMKKLHRDMLKKTS